jgi:hypothetical protein
MKPLQRTKILVGLMEAAHAANEASTLAGRWKDNPSPQDLLNTLSREITKAAEQVDSGERSEKFPEVSKFEETLADLIIISLDMAVAKNLLVITALCNKLEYNLSKARVVNGT